MKKRFSRGTALPETALTIGLSLLLVLGTAQMALIGYTQMSADGAAFVAAHTVVIDPSASPGAVVQSIFPNIASQDVQAASNGNMETATVARSIAGFSFVPGLASSYTISGSDVELIPSPMPSNAPTFAFGANATLYNYCEAEEDDGEPPECDFPSEHSMYLAQQIIPGGNGVNGQFQEWGCHDGYFDELAAAFSANTPGTPITPGSALDMGTPGTLEYTIYSWDSGTPCS